MATDISTGSTLSSDDDNIALFDLDGSLADYDGKLIADLEAMRSPLETPITDLRTAERADYIKARMDRIKGTPGWWAGLPVIQNGLTVLNLAREIGFLCRVLTKGPRSHPTAWKEKLEWSFAKLGNIDVTITFDKSSVYGKLLYDDFPEYCYSWLKHRPRGLVIMPVKKITSAHDHPRILQWDGTNLEQVRAVLTACYNRKPHEPMIIPA